MTRLPSIGSHSHSHARSLDQTRLPAPRSTAAPLLGCPHNTSRSYTPLLAGVTVALLAAASDWARSMRAASPVISCL
ncbi:hypothetical protein GGF50DRAFT_121829 [Schizophyllum commune]